MHIKEQDSVFGPRNGTNGVGNKILFSDQAWDISRLSDHRWDVGIGRGQILSTGQRLRHILDDNST